ncbi:hypothetical protein HDU88_008847 [Geranomyces variabilis]|nr:hypothetical protein HDU88_008847 [Geranomyces variabilis]
MDAALALSPTSLYAQQRPAGLPPPPPQPLSCRKRKGYDDGVQGDWGSFKRMHLDTSPATLCHTQYPHSAEWPPQQQQHSQQPFHQDTSNAQRCPPAQFDHRALQAQLELHLQQLSPEGSNYGSAYDPRTKPPYLYNQQLEQQQHHMQDVYDFQDVHRKLMACGGASPGDAMLVDELSPTTTSSGVGPTSPASSDMMCMSPQPQRRSGSGNSAAPVFTPMPSPQRGGQRGGMQVTMGFRKDCEKCRQGVPGHYMHLMNR